jgi:superoxide dismutase
MWEHTYFRDYLKDKKNFIYKTMQELNWEVIESRIKRTDKVAKIYGGEL